jgi:hypothetical protein
VAIFAGYVRGISSVSFGIPLREMALRGIHPFGSQKLLRFLGASMKCDDP